MSNPYILKSLKAIEFYNKNNHLDFNTMNEMFVDIITKLTSSVQTTISVNEIKSLLHNINNKVDKLDDTLGNSNLIVKMTYDCLNNNKDFYIQEVKIFLKIKKKILKFYN